MFRNLRWYRYVWREATAPTLLGVLLWTFLLMMNAFFLVAERALSKNLGWELTLQMFAYEVPKLLVMSIPMGVLLGVLIAVGRLSADHEWVALQSAGYGPSRLLRPLLAFGLLATVLTFGIYAVLVPRTHYASRLLQGEMIFRSNLASDLRAGVFYTRLIGTVMFVDNIRPGTEGRLQGVMIHRSRAYGDSDQLILARAGDLYPVPDDSGDLSFVGRSCVVHTYGPSGSDAYRQLRFDVCEDQIPAPPFLRGLRRAPSRTAYDLDPVELWDDLRDARADTALDPAMREVRIRTALLELNRRVALPMASLLFAFLALPLGITRARSGKGAGFALSLAVVLIYWAIFTTCEPQARAGALPPWLGVWSANLVILPWALIAYLRLRRSRGESRGLLRSIGAGVEALARAFRRAPGTAPAAAGGEPEDDAAPPLGDLGGTGGRFVGRLDQYVGLRFVRLVGLTLGAAYLIYAIVDLKRVMEGVTRGGHPSSMVLSYFVYALPGMINLALPVACLVAAVVTFTVLARTGELTAIKAGGISARRALVPVLVVTLGCCLVLSLLQDRVTPTTNRKAGELKDQLLGRAPITYGMPAGGKWAFGPGGKRLYHYRLYDPDRQVFQGLSVFSLDRSGDQPRVLEHGFSAVARWDGTQWQLEGGWRRTFPADRSPALYEEIEGSHTARFDPPENFTRREAALTTQGSGLQDQMSLRELSEQIRTLDSSGYDTTRIEVAYWGKLAQTVTPLVMVLLGLPFAFGVGRRGSLYGVGVAILLVILYWATFAVFNALGLETILPPLLAAWAPNVLYGLLGTYLILYIKT